MNKIEYLKKEIDSMSGNVLGFGIDDKEVINKILENKNITTFNILDNSKNNEKNESKSKNKKINNLRKYFKKKKIDTIICNTDLVSENRIKLIYDTLYIGKKNIYLYSLNDITEEFMNKYKRYTKNIEKIICNDTFMYKIVITNIKNNILKEKTFKLFDHISYYINLISDTLSE